MNKEVYYRCIWTVRDLDRLRKLAEMRDSATGDINEMYCPDETGSDGMTLVSEAALERAAYEVRIIEEALETVPESYRQGVIDNITGRAEFNDFAHPNTWKKWKQSFIYELARRMHMI